MNPTLLTPIRLTPGKTEAEALSMSRFQHAEQVSREIQDRFRNCGYASLRNVECVLVDGTLTLYGKVPSYHMKQVAQSLVLNLDGVVRLVNQVVVDDSSN